MVELFIFIIIFSLITIIFLYKSHENELNYKYINNIDIENNVDFFNNLNIYFNTINSYLIKLNLKKYKYEFSESNDFDSKLKSYIKNYKNIHDYLNNELSENIKVKKFFTKNKNVLIEFLTYIYNSNIQYTKKNKLKEYYEIFIEKLNKDLNCCATIWNINLFFEHINKNFNYKK